MRVSPRLRQRTRPRHSQSLQRQQLRLRLQQNQIRTLSSFPTTSWKSLNLIVCFLQRHSHKSQKIQLRFPKYVILIIPMGRVKVQWARPAEDDAQTIFILLFALQFKIRMVFGRHNLIALNVAVGVMEKLISMKLLKKDEHIIAFLLTHGSKANGRRRLIIF